MSHRNQFSSDSTPPPPPPQSPSPPSPPLALPNRESADSDLVPFPDQEPSDEAHVIYKQILVAQGNISRQLEQIANTMGLMTRTLNQRMDAENFLIYRKIDRLATALDLQEVPSQPKKEKAIPPASSKLPLPRSKSVLRK